MYNRCVQHFMLQDNFTPNNNNNNNKCSRMAQETLVQSQVESYQRLKKWYLMPPCLAFSIIWYWSSVKWSNPGKEVAPFLTPWCSRYQKGSPRVILDYGRQFYYNDIVRIQDSVHASIQWQEDYIKSVEEDWSQQPETIQTTQASTE